MSIDPKILAKLQAQTEIPLPSRDGDLAAVQRCLPCSLEGTPKQVSWAEGIRMQALLLKWQDAVLSKLARIKDATWWIANKGILDTCKFKEPLPQQMTGCSLILPVSEEAKRGQPESKGSGPAAHLLENIRLDQLAKRLSDAEKWAESVSHQPKMAEAAILAVLSRLYKDPMKSRLRTRSWAVLSEAKCAIEKDEDAIRKMLSR